MIVYVLNKRHLKKSRKWIEYLPCQLQDENREVRPVANLIRQRKAHLTIQLTAWLRLIAIESHQPHTFYRCAFRI
ncbi:hypothetical protein BJP36_38015 [Moorena producens JHB]|uniref:Uncharacterized protein n=1 Tax=Moorena producens (strain JHB) TaxID=1454205 RepID=A0A9Q9UWG9_MOOP1|nr:hypothetical protein [Moorena producens]WAN69891.1 hypothetical protein BJP36_38015 [Moorena producens JHB]